VVIKPPEPPDYKQVFVKMQNPPQITCAGFAILGQRCCQRVSLCDAFKAGAMKLGR